MRLVMMGTGPFAVPTFNSLFDDDHDLVALFTRPTPPPRGRRKTPANPMREVAQVRRVDVYAPDSINSPEAHALLAPCEADLFVVCDYGQILSSTTLAYARLGGINLHGSLLPRFRGAAPVNWAIYHGESITGVTVIHMSPKLDAGPCLVQRQLEIDPDETAIQLEVRLAHLGVQPVLQAIQLLSSWDGASAIGQPQDATLVSNAPRLKKEDGLVDWSRAAAEIKNQVRAFQPWPNTFTYWQKSSGQSLRLILLAVSVIPLDVRSLTPGQVVHSNGKQLHVATGQDALSLDCVQPSGKRGLNVDEFLRGYPMQTGDRLGNEP